MIRFGFFISLLEIFRQILAQVAYQRKSYNLLYLTFVLQALDTTFVIIDFTLMQMWRWDVPGKVCSGDYAKESPLTPDTSYCKTEGLFLKVIIISAYVILGLTCLSIVVIAIFLSQKKT